MKQWLIAAVLILCTMLCGCQSGIFQKEVQPEELQLTFRCPAEIQMGEKRYTCEIFHSISQQTEITITESGVLNGLKYRQSNGDAELLYGELEYFVQKSGFAEESCFPKIANILDYAQSYVNLQPMGENTFQGSVNGGDFLITADDDGNIMKLEAENLSVIFDVQTGNGLK